MAVELKSKLSDRVIDHHRLSADFKSLLHDILIEHRPEMFACVSFKRPLAIYEQVVNKQPVAVCSA